MKTKHLTTLLLLQLLIACASPQQKPPAPALPPALMASAPQETAPPTVEDAAPVAQQDEKNIYFALGKAQLNAESERKLSVHAARLKANPKLALRLIGHTDNLGSTAYNLAISEKRVMKVREFLLAKGTKPSQVSGYGVGDEMQSGTCPTGACRQKMRRVELIYQH